MSDQSQPQTSGAQTTGLVIPPDVQEKFGTLIDMIKGSESMNNEERQYWINILPIMTEDQIKNLEEILTNEKQQLTAIDAKYSKDAAATAGSTADIAAIEQKIKNRKKERMKTEQQDAEHEERKEEDLMAQIQAL